MASLIDDPQTVQFRDDPNNYRIGTVPSSDPAVPHHVALAMMPRDGTRHAAVMCTNLLRTFPNVQCVIMTGIAGGIPRPHEPSRHVRLGDVVVATEGVVDYGHVRQVDGVRRLRRSDGMVSGPLVRAARELQFSESNGHRPWERWLDPEHAPQADSYRRPSDDADRLFVRRSLVPHPDRSISGHPSNGPKIHYGAVASADVLMRDEEARDDLARDFGEVFAVEMEGSGIAASTAAHDVHWFMVRGVADYCERVGKNDLWHRTASYVAAAYVRALLEACRPFRMVLPLVAPADRGRVDVLLQKVPPDRMPAVWDAAPAHFPRPPVTTMAPLGAFRHLSTLNADVDGLPPALAFVELLAAHGTTEPEIARDLRQWATEQAAYMRVGDALANWRSRPAQVSTSADAKPSLLVEITIDGIDRRYCRITCWIQERSGPWNPQPGDSADRVLLDHAETVVESMVDRAEQHWAESTDSPAIEFLLPTGLLNLPVEWWRTHGTSSQPLPLCVDYPVVLRSLDRMHNYTRPRMWGARWSALFDRSQTHQVHWGGDQEHLAAWDVQLRSDARIASVVLSGPPESPPGRDELDMALRAGVPVILWSRRGRRSPDATAAIQRLIEADPVTLPFRTRALRAEAASAPPGDRDDHPGTFIALLFDNPNHVVTSRTAQ